MNIFDNLFNAVNVGFIFTNVLTLLITFVSLGLLFLGFRYIKKVFRADDSGGWSRSDIARQKASFREGWVGKDEWVSPRSRRENGYLR